jgi:hypothetical protein
MWLAVHRHRVLKGSAVGKDAQQYYHNLMLTGNLLKSEGVYDEHNIAQLCRVEITSLW